MKETGQLTKQLIAHLEILKDMFLAAKENQSENLPFEIIQKESTPIFLLIEAWEKSTAALVKERKVNLHPAQVQATTENMEMLLMHSYFRDVRIKKYMETYKSCRYIFEQLLGGIQDEKTIN